ncbi:septum formation family protein, partial [Saccharopolyspora sp. NPDC002376]
SEEGWADGDRTLHCGLQQPGPSGKLYPIKGSASTTDQSNIYPEGRCLGINGTAVWDPVDCAKPHAVEITGMVNLGDEFPGGWPAEKDQDPFLFNRCAELTERFAGGPNVAKDKGLVIYWDTLPEESWNAGSRQVNCKVSAQLPDGSGLAPVTGSVKGEVRVGKEPAPQITTAGQPGAPAAEPR